MDHSLGQMDVHVGSLTYSVVGYKIKTNKVDDCSTKIRDVKYTTQELSEAATQDTLCRELKEKTEASLNFII